MENLLNPLQVTQYDLIKKQQTKTEKKEIIKVLVELLEQKNSKKTFECPACSRSFVNKQCLTYHCSHKVCEKRWHNENYSFFKNYSNK